AARIHVRSGRRPLASPSHGPAEASPGRTEPPLAPGAVGPTRRSTDVLSGSIRRRTATTWNPKRWQSARLLADPGGRARSFATIHQSGPWPGSAERHARETPRPVKDARGRFIRTDGV